MVGLIAYLTEGAAAFPSGSQSDLLIGIVTIPVILAIYLLVNRLRGKVLKETDVKGLYFIELSVRHRKASFLPLSGKLYI